jgi:HEAT repeat protein
MKLFTRISLLPFLVAVLFLTACGERTGGDRSVNVPQEIQRLESPEAETRIDAIIELAKAGPHAESAVPHLIPLLKDRHIDVRRLSAYALGEIGPSAKPALPALDELLDDNDMYVRSAALNAMRAIDPDSTDEVIVNIMEN